MRRCLVCEAMILECFMLFLLRAVDSECSQGYQRQNNFTKSYFKEICLMNSPYLLSNDPKRQKTFRNVERTHDISSCHLLIEFSNISFNSRRLCPESCQPSVHFELSLEWLSNSVNELDYVTCSISYKSMLSALGANSLDYIRHNLTKIFDLLEFLSWRRLQECYEQHEWLDIIPQYVSTVERRKIHSLIIWVGTTSNILLLNLQQSMLRSFPFSGDSAVVGWSATEEQYPCKNGTVLCKGANAAGYYGAFLPTTGLSKEGERSFGWGCAQRRPLRALAHTLLLFDPDLLLLVDDDTYVNYPLFATALESRVLATLSVNPVIIGRLQSPRVLSPVGFFTGGAGYLMGREVLRRLTAHSLRDFRQHRDPYSKHLSLLRALRERESSGRQQNSSSSSGSNHTSCIHSSPAGPDGLVGVSGRLVDFCVTLLANERTCHHSDHSVSRCLFYGAGASPIGAPCDRFEFSTSSHPQGDQTPPPPPQELSFSGAAGGLQMCPLSGVPCHPEHHFTCHHRRPLSFNDSTPVNCRRATHRRRRR